jgi:ApbE superfamily uncharacterized protein (UPF0280 family)
MADQQDPPVWAQVGNLNTNIYRGLVSSGEKYHWHFIFRHSDLLISADTDVGSGIEKILTEIYSKLEYVIEHDRKFKDSLLPVRVKSFYPAEIKRMCLLSSEFSVGPMAAVAGLVNDFIAEKLQDFCRSLIIENGGDVFIRSDRDIRTGLFIKNPFFKDRIVLKIDKKYLPCGLCSSSGTFGHSLSLGKCDLAVVMSDSATSADAAATAVANSVSNEEDVQKSLEHFSTFDSIKGLVIVKDKKIGIWGNLELAM